MWRIALLGFFLKKLSIAIGLFTSDASAVVDIDGWKDYVWRVRASDQCIQVDKSGFCQIADDRWDWKRDQRYTFSFLTDAKSNSLLAHLRLNNRDPSDDDYVCVVAIFTDKNDEQIAIFFQDWLSRHGRSLEKDLPLHPSLPVSSIAKVAVGSKQCDLAGPSDAAIFEEIRLKLNQR